MKKRNRSALVFLAMKSKEKHSVYVPKKCSEEKHLHLLLIGEEETRHYVLIKGNNVNTFLCYHTLHHKEKTFTVIIYKLLV